MKPIALVCIVLTGALFAPATGFAQVSCSRDGLQRAVDLYIAAQTKGDICGMPLATGLGYVENVERVDINNGLIKTPMLVAAANAYLDAFLEGKKDLVPWGYPCNRTEGGAHAGNGSPRDSCDVGVPSGVNISNRRFVVDPTIGSVVVYCTFGAGNATGGSGAPDTHLFRVENGKLRYVHTLTHLLQANFRGGRGGARGGGAGGQGAPAGQGADTAPASQR